MKPGDFLIGLKDFFAVLVPGAVLAFLITSAAQGIPNLPNWWDALVNTFSKLDPAQSTLASAIIAYGLGQMVASLSSLLDGPVDWFEQNFGQRTGKYLLWGIDPKARFVTYRGIATDLKDKVGHHLFLDARD